MEDVNKIAADHWEYIKSLLIQHKIDLPELNRIGFHYRTAFIHGYKHGIDHINKPTNFNAKALAPKDL